MTVVKAASKLNIMPKVISRETTEVYRSAKRSTMVERVQDPARWQSQIDIGSASKNHIKTVKDWVSQINSYQKQADVFTKAQTGTGQWFLEHEEFQSWTTDGSQILWCHGLRKSSVASSNIEI